LCGTHHLCENLDGRFLKHLKIQFDDGMKRKGLSGFELHAAMADVAGGADVGVTTSFARTAILPPDFDFALKSTTLIESFFSHGLIHVGTYLYTGVMCL
jgi:hypothetical protein